MKTKSELLKGLDYLYNRQPSKWDLALITRFKMFLLPDLITFVSGAPDQIKHEEDQTIKNAAEVFGFDPQEVQ